MKNIKKGMSYIIPQSCLTGISKQVDPNKYWHNVERRKILAVTRSNSIIIFSLSH